MAGIDIKRFLSNFGQNYHQQTTFSARGTFNAPAQPAPEAPVPKPAPAQIPSPQTQSMPAPPQAQSAFIKDVMGFPRNANEFVYMVQRGMTQTQFNQMFNNQMLAQRNNLSQMQAQILAQLQGLDINTAKEMINAQLSSQVQGSLRNLEILSSGMINLNQISMLLQQNGKEAITKIIMTMTEASKSGITDLSQLKEMAKLINASISVASENNPQKTLKLLLMLYLPWLPLEDGTGFDLEIQNKSENHEESDSVIVITVSTINYGTVRTTIYLESSNSVQTTIECSENFPKTELKLRIEGEQKHYSMDSVLTFETNDGIKEQNYQKQSANINMSQTTEINPYLLLMAHTIIKHIIDIDNNTTAGITSHTDKF
ncbi:hypothetical protein IJ541_10160 [bacterium]|nr:hypothetical protein [bacterium]